MDGGDDRFHHRHNFPFQLLEKKDDQVSSSSATTATAYPSLAISTNHHDLNPTLGSNPSTLPTTTTAAATSSTELSKKQPPNKLQPKIDRQKSKAVVVAFECPSSAPLGFSN